VDGHGHRELRPGVGRHLLLLTQTTNLGTGLADRYRATQGDLRRVREHLEEANRTA